MKHLCYTIIALALLAATDIYGQKINTAQRPNIIIVLSDDQGYGDFSCHGNPVLSTPALDKMYNESVRLTNFHSAPLCTPTRGQLMSGMDALNNKASTVLNGRGLIRRDIAIMPEIFAHNGYNTGLFGKWHLGDTYPDRPFDKGFKKSIWIKGWGLLSESEFDNDYYKTRYMDSLDVKFSDKYCTDLWFDEAMSWMEQQKGGNTPFLTYIALNAPHGPYHAPKDEEAYYLSKNIDTAAASFLGMVSNIDKNMARLDEWLIRKGMKNNTLVIYMTDNGGTGGVKVFNAGMRGQKGSNYDGGHRVPCFISWPAGGFGTGRSINYAAHVTDLLPTFIDILGLKLKKQQKFDGVSLKPVLRQAGKKFSDRMFVVQHTGKENPEKYFGCVVWDNWRLVGADELYDIQNDPGQKNNIAAAHPAVYKKMKDYYDSWWSRLEPTLDDYVPVVIGNPKENPVVLTSNSWLGAGGINTQWGVALANGATDGGTWLITAEETGTYRLALSRWPPELKRALTVNGPSTAVGGTNIRPGKALPVKYANMVLDNTAPVTIEARPGADSVEFEINIAKGTHHLKAWFLNGQKENIGAAYYIKVQKIR